MIAGCGICEVRRRKSIFRIVILYSVTIYLLSHSSYTFAFCIIRIIILYSCKILRIYSSNTCLWIFTLLRQFSVHYYLTTMYLTMVTEHDVCLLGTFGLTEFCVTTFLSQRDSIWLITIRENIGLTLFNSPNGILN
jgi:hypothetical protein